MAENVSKIATVVHVDVDELTVSCYLDVLYKPHVRQKYKFFIKCPLFCTAAK